VKKVHRAFDGIGIQFMECLALTNGPGQGQVFQSLHDIRLVKNLPLPEPLFTKMRDEPKRGSASF
jgi:hypothetical protein